MMTRIAKLPIALVIAFLACGAHPALSEKKEGEVIHLMNGKDLSPFYTYLKDFGRDKIPDEVFSIQDGILHISGQHWGYLNTHEEFENYRLLAEFKWGGKTWGEREKAARDSGILVHSTGEDGAYGGTWMYGIEIQIIEGGTGDLLVVADKSDKFSITSEAAPEMQGSCHVFQEGGEEVTLNIGRLNWRHRDPGWEDVIDFRGEKDIEKPVGEWNSLDIRVEGDTIEVKLNGELVNRATQVRPSKGRIQIQSEGAEILFRKIDLIPLD
jgi:hypothetical protein